MSVCRSTAESLTPRLSQFTRVLEPASSSQSSPSSSPPSRIRSPDRRRDISAGARPPRETGIHSHTDHHLARIELRAPAQLIRGHGSAPGAMRGCTLGQSLWHADAQTRGRARRRARTRRRITFVFFFAFWRRRKRERWWSSLPTFADLPPGSLPARTITAPASFAPPPPTATTSTAAGTRVARAHLPSCMSSSAAAAAVRRRAGRGGGGGGRRLYAVRNRRGGDTGAGEVVLGAAAFAPSRARGPRERGEGRG